VTALVYHAWRCSGSFSASRLHRYCVVGLASSGGALVGDEGRGEWRAWMQEDVRYTRMIMHMIAMPSSIEPDGTFLKYIVAIFVVEGVERKVG
jgi:hypothetical protein